MADVEPAMIAEEAGLRYVDPHRLPIERRPCGRGFRYERSGEAIPDSTREWVESLAIPPAWTDVRIAASDRPHVLAVGVDADGRTQYRYNPAFREAADRLKYARLVELGFRLPRLRSTLQDALAAGVHDELAVSTIASLIDRTAIRVGSVRYAECNGTYGASTLERRHVDVDGDVVALDFVAKGGVERHAEVVDAVLARSMAERLRDLDDAAAPIFSGPEGGRVSGATVARSLTTWAGMSMSAKELRTWSASARMVHALMEPDSVPEDASDDPVLAAYDAVADHLGNTRAIARSSYVTPAIVTAFEDGKLDEAWRRSRRSDNYTRAEQALRKVLAVD